MPRKTLQIEVTVELEVYYEICEAEPDVGVMTEGVDDFSVMGVPKLLGAWRDQVLEELNGSLPEEDYENDEK